MGNILNYNYQSCMEAAELKTTRHFLLSYSAFTRLKLKHLGERGEKAETLEFKELQWCSVLSYLSEIPVGTYNRIEPLT